MLAWLQLTRLPTIFTAIADTLMAIVVVRGETVPLPQSVAVVIATISLYWAGMILNDYCDREIDAEERPSRPIPSGRIAAPVARNAAIGLFVVGIGGAGTASWMMGTVWCVLLATLLTAAIVAYDTWLKHTPWGPVGMGSCRALNVLMAMTGVTNFTELSQVPGLIPLGLLVYIAGVTLLARDEAARPRRLPLVLATFIAMAGIGLLAWSRPVSPTPISFHLTTIGWVLLWITVALFTLRRFVAAIVQPRPATVIGAVKHALLSLILIDAALALSAGGPYWACAILALMAPAMLLSQSIRMT
jgi:4-hydroxybenzoate polyprenyltransferase